MSTRYALCASLLALALIPSARATTSTLLVNGLLDKDATTPIPSYNLVYLSPTLNSTALPGWTITSGTVDLVPSVYWQPAPGCSYSVDLVGTPGVGGIQQSVSTVATTGYTLTFDFSINPQAGPFNETGTEKILRIEALDGSNVIATQDYSGLAGTRTLTNMEWATDTFQFTATSATTTLMLFAVAPAVLPAGATASTIYCGPVIDNLTLISGGSNPTPEPASLGLLGVGATAVLLKRRRGR